jgi:hypothetical protein
VHSGIFEIVVTVYYFGGFAELSVTSIDVGSIYCWDVQQIIGWTVRNGVATLSALKASKYTRHYRNLLPLAM